MFFFPLSACSLPDIEVIGEGFLLRLVTTPDMVTSALVCHKLPEKIKKHENLTLSNEN